MFHKAVSLPTLLLVLGTPLAASAASPSQLCAAAQSDPAAFFKRADFPAAVIRMSGLCPELAFAMTNLPTGSVPTQMRGPGKDGPSASNRTAKADHAALLKRLARATQDIDTATARVGSARLALEATIRHAHGAGLDEGDLAVAVALTRAGDRSGLRDILPDFTARKRAALQDYLDARDRLDAANDRLDAATEAAKPLVERAMALAGESAEAQSALADLLGADTAAERQARLDRQLAEAKALTDALAAQIARSAADLEQAKRDLAAALENRAYRAALAEIADEEADIAVVKGLLAEGESVLHAAEAQLAAARQDRDACKGKCNKLENAVKEAENHRDAVLREIARGTAELERNIRQLDRARRDLADIEARLGLADLGARIVGLAADISQAEAQKDDTAGLAALAEAETAKLVDLLTRAATAMDKADTARTEAEAATADEETAVADAHAALTRAIEAAQAALAGSPEEDAALKAVMAARDALEEALDDLGAAQDVAQALMDEAGAIVPDAAEVTEAVGDLTEASDAADATEAEAEATQDDADAAVADHQDAQSDLEDAVGSDS